MKSFIYNIGAIILGLLLGILILKIYFRFYFRQIKKQAEEEKKLNEDIEDLYETMIIDLQTTIDLLNEQNKNCRLEIIRLRELLLSFKKKGQLNEVEFSQIFPSIEFIHEK